MTQKLLDLFCCAGGATRGYQNAGFSVTGVDLNARPSYCGDDFFQGDALAYARAYARNFDFIHASPPCQGLSTITPEENRGDYPELITPVREILLESGVPFVIENVVPAVNRGLLRKDLLLCGEMFGLRVIRHRVFEFGNGAEFKTLNHIKHQGNVKGAGRRSRGTYSSEGYYCGVYGVGTDKGTTEEWREAMGIDWMTDRHDLAESLPPAYTQYIGEIALKSV